MRILYCGSGEFGVPCLNAIKNSRHQLVQVFTQPSHPAGRGRKPRATPVAHWAAENEIPFAEIRDINTIEPQEIETNLDLMVVIAFGQKISPEVIRMPRHGAINVHASLLPKYRGAAPINWAIINGESETGISIITLAERMDAGEILAQAKTAIGSDETASGLHDRLAQIAPPVLIKTIDEIESGTANYQPQDNSLATKAPKFKKSDGFIEWSEPAWKVCNKIRGLWAWPEAESYYVSKKTGKCERVIFAKCRAVPNNSSKFSGPGTIDEHFNIICGQDAVNILLIKPAGSDLMDFKSFINGRHTQPGDCFLKIDEGQIQK